MMIDELEKKEYILLVFAATKLDINFMPVHESQDAGEILDR